MIDMLVGILESSREIVPFSITIALTICFSLLIIYFAVNSKFIIKKIRDRRYFWGLLFLIILLGMGLRIATPVFYPTYFDELTNIEVAKNIIYHAQPVVCSYISPEQISCYMHIFPATFSYVLAVFFVFLGISMSSAYIASTIIGSLVVLLLSVSVYLMFKNERIALWSGFFASIFPLYILHSKTLEDDMTFVLFTLLALIAFTLLLKRKDLKTGIFATACLAIAVSAKQEGLIFLFLFVVFVILFSDQGFLKGVYRKRKFWYLVILFVLLIIPHIMYLSIQLYPTLLYGKKTGLAPEGLLVFENFRNNVWILERFSGTFYPWIFNLFVIIGILCSVKKFRKELVFLSLLFFLFLFVYLTYSGGVHERYLLTVYMPLIIMGGTGVFYTEKLISGFISKKTGLKNFSRHVPLLVTLVLVLIVMLSFLPFLDKLDDVMPLNSRNGYSRDHVFYMENLYIESVKVELGNSYVVVESPPVFAATHVKPIGTFHFLTSYNQSDPVGIFGNIYYFEDLFCTDLYSFGSRCGIEGESHETCEVFRKGIVGKCEEMHEEFELVPFSEYIFNVSENIRIQHRLNTSTGSFHIYEINGRGK